MIRFQLVGALLVVATALSSVAGWRLGRSALQAQHDAAVRKLEDNLATITNDARRDAERLIELQQQMTLTAERLADEAREDPDADRRALGRESVRRIFSQ